VKSIELGDGNEADATLEIDDSYAPLPENTQAILRQKTLLGETYVELTPGSNAADTIPEGGTLPAAQVGDSVQLDEIFRTFDAPTRAAFQQWMQSQAVAVDGRGADLSAALGELDPFAESAQKTLRILDTQSEAIRQLVRDGGDVFTALSERRGQLRGLIQNTDTVFRTTAARNEELAQTFEIFPTFLRETRLTLDRLKQFSVDTDPLVRQLRPAAQELGPTVADLGALAPSAQRFFVGLRGAIQARSGLSPALRDLLHDDLPPLLTRLPDYLNEVDPILAGVKPYKSELTAFLANTSVAINSTNGVGGVTVNRLRTSVPLGPETLATFPSRLTTNRTDPYMKPGGYLDLNPSNLGHLLSFETRQCTGGGLTATIADEATIASDPDFASRITSLAPQDQFTTPAEFYDNLLLYALGDNTPGNGATTAATPAPPCDQQGDYESIGKVTPELSQFQHIYRQGTP
jgi:phospholipid/cholesterol/gamma-HCH transport system substrate-binding protein